MPWSLHVVGYSWRDAHRYLARRILRLDPPYFATVFIVLALTYLGTRAGLRQEPFVVDWSQLASHIAYLTAIVHERWYNPVFWTLAIEFQFYLVLGFLFPFIASRHRAPRWIAMMLCLAAFLPMFQAGQKVWMTEYLPLFMLGFLLFQAHAGIIGRRELWIWAVPLLAVTASYTYILALLSFVAFGVMLEDRYRNAVTEFLGRISYSLYLIHMPLGIPFERIAMRFADSDLQRCFVALAGAVFCIGVAWIFYRLVERPSIALARRVKLHPAAARRAVGDAAAQRLPWAIAAPGDERAEERQTG